MTVYGEQYKLPNGYNNLSPVACQIGVKLERVTMYWIQNKYYYNKYNLSEVLLLNRIHGTLTDLTLQVATCIHKLLNVSSDVIFTEGGRMVKEHHQQPNQSTIFVSKLISPLHQIVKRFGYSLNTISTDDRITQFVNNLK